MKFNFLAILASAALILGACSSNEKKGGGDERNPENEKSVFIQINTAKNTRAVEPTATGTEAVLYTALVYFLDGNNVVNDVRTVGTNGEDIALEDLEDGVLVEGISSEVTQVYVIGNYNSSDQANNFPDFPTEDGLMLSDIQAVLLDIQQVSHGSLADGTTTNNLITVMDGRANILDFSTTPGGWNGTATLGPNDVYANVTISPVVARIEIEQITYTGDYTTLTLEGIYINNYYTQLPLSLDLTSRAPVNNGSDITKYQIGNANFAYTYYMSLYEYIGASATPAGTETFAPTAGNVWAFQVFGDSAPVPHVILKLTGVTSASGAPVSDRYVTVVGFMGPSGEIGTLERNTIYKIVDLEFEDSDTELVPEPETINVWVHVEVEPWTTVIVTPII